MKLNKKRVILATVAILTGITLLVSVGMIMFNPTIANAENMLSHKEIEVERPKEWENTVKYGFTLDSFLVVSKKIQTNDNLTKLLVKYHIPSKRVSLLEKKAKNIIDFSKLQPARPYMILCEKENNIAQYFIYEPTPYRYIVCDLRDTLQVTAVDRDVELRYSTASGMIYTTLWDAMVDNNLSYELVSRMEDALKWSVDFYHILPGDRYKLVFEEKYVEGEPVGVGRLQVAYFRHNKKDIYAFLFEDEKNDIKGYYDFDGRTMKRTFLKSPLKVMNITSRYDLNRFHPVLKVVRPHLGTDYAAPEGTPILATADGTLETVGQDDANGKYVRIFHDKIYQSAYLHMSKHGEGMSAGVKVKQGDVIGYVGMTGWATGPHTCYRFWKNGQQVDPLLEEVNSSSAPLERNALTNFVYLRDSLVKTLDKIPYPTAEEMQVNRKKTKVQ